MGVFKSPSSSFTETFMYSSYSEMRPRDECRESRFNAFRPVTLFKRGIKLRFPNDLRRRKLFTLLMASIVGSRVTFVHPPQTSATPTAYWQTREVDLGAAAKPLYLDSTRTSHSPSAN